MKRLETHGANRFDDETELKQEVLRRLDENDESYREISKETFYVSGEKRHVSPAQISRWKKQTATKTSGTKAGEVAAEAFKMFEEGASPSEVVIALKQAPGVISELYDSWAELRGCLVVDSHLRNLIQSKTNLPIEDQADLIVAIARLVEDQEKLRGFRYPCSRCGGLIQASPNTEWVWMIQKGRVSAWSHKQCPLNVKQGVN